MNLSSGFFVSPALAAASSSFTAVKTVDNNPTVDDQTFSLASVTPNTAAGTDDQTIALANVIANAVPGNDDQTAAVSTTVANEVAGNDDQTAATSTTVANAAAGVDNQSAATTTTVEAQGPGVDNQTAAASTTQNNVAEVKATRTITVNSRPGDAQSITIGQCVVGFDDGAGVADNSLSTDDLDCTGGATINNYTLTNPGVARMTGEIAALLRSLQNVTDDLHGAVAVSGSGDDATFTTAGTETVSSGIPFMDGTFGSISTVLSQPGVVAVSQISRVTPSNVEIGDGFTVIINASSTTFIATTTDPNNVVDGLVAAINLSVQAVNVTAADLGAYLEITADNPGTAFTLATSTTNYGGATQQTTVTPANVEVGDTFTITINGTDISFTATSTDASETVDGLVSAINLSAEAANVTASDGNTYVEISANATGTPFTIISSTLNYAGVAQISRVTPANVETGDEFTVTINGTDISFTATSVLAADVVDGLVSAINGSAQAANVTASDGDTYVEITANATGTPFTIISSTLNYAGVAQISRVTPANVETGDEFTVTINGTDISFTATSTDASETVDGLVSAINLSAEAANVTASDGDTYVEIVADAAGTPFAIVAATLNYAGVAQVDDLTPANIETGDIFSVSGVSDSAVSVTAAATSVTAVVDALATAINATSTTVTATNSADKLRLTAVVAGTAFTAATSTVNRAAVAQVDDLTPANIETGDIFSVSGVSDSAVSVTAAATSVTAVVDALATAINATSTTVTATNSADKLRLTAVVAGTAFTATTTVTNADPTAQVVTFTPASVVMRETFVAAINGTSYSFQATNNTAKTTVEGLAPLVNANAAVSCVEDDIKIICTAAVPGTAFTYSASVTAAPAGGGGGGISSSPVTQTDDSLTKLQSYATSPDGTKTTSETITRKSNGTVTNVAVSAVIRTVNSPADTQSVRLDVSQVSELKGVQVDLTKEAIKELVGGAAGEIKVNLTGQEATTVQKSESARGGKFLLGFDVFSFEITANGSAVKNFELPLDLTFDVGNIVSRDSLRVYYFDTISNKWTIQGDGGTLVVDKLVVKTDHLTDFGIIRESQETAAAAPAETASVVLSDREKQMLQIEDDANVVYASGRDLNTILAHNNAAKNVEAQSDGMNDYIPLLKKGMGELPVSNIYAINNFVVYGTITTRGLGAGERAGVVNSYKQAYGKLPASPEEWLDCIAIGNGRWPKEVSATAEKKAKEEFAKIYLRAADMSDFHDNAAVTVISYGLRPSDRNMGSEAAGSRIFKGIYKHNPSSALDWDIVRAISYSGAVR